MLRRLLFLVPALLILLGLGGGSARAQMVLPTPNHIATLAGSATAGYSGDGGLATAAELDNLEGIFVDSSGNIYIADYSNNRVRKVTAATWDISTVAGNGGTTYNLGTAGDGGYATSAPTYEPQGIVVDSSGNLYLTDTELNVVRKVNGSTGIISIFAGTGMAGYSGDGAAAISAMLKTPEGLGIDTSGNVYIVDSGNRRIRKVTISTGIITTVAGNGTNGALGDGGLATSASINSQGSTLGFDSAGNLYFADTLNNRIREVKASTGIITTIAGTGIGAYYGDGGAATSAMVNAPEGVAVDWAGNVYIADTANNRIRAISSSTGKMSTVAGTGSATYSGDGGLATSAAVNWPGGVAVDSGGNLYISDEDNNRVRVVANTLPTTTTVTTSNASIYYDVNVTFTAAVTASSGTPTGTVTFYSDGTSIGTGTLSGGTVSISTSNLAIGTHLITANYPGNPPYLSSSGSLAQTITMVPTGITFTTSPNPSTVTNPVNVQIHVSASNGATVGGAVSVVADGSNSLGTPTLNGSGAASVSTSSLAVGSHSIAVSYGGNATYDSSSVTQSQTVNKIATSTAVTASVATSSYSQCVTYQATVTGTQGTPTGTVTFTANSTSLGSATLNGSGVASVSSCSLTTASYTITAAYGGATNFTTSSGTTQETVIRATVALTWATPAAITYGAALGGAQLDASSGGVAGTYVYTPAAGTVLTAGSHILSVTFNPTDTNDYNSGSASVSLQVNKATPTITWATPAAITYGAALGGAQLNASSGGLAGSYVYSPAAGAVLGAGSHTLSVTFTPSDTTDYNGGSASVSLTVNKATPTITWATPAAITYGTALSGTQLNASSGGLAGSYVYSPAAGAVLSAGSQTLSVTFTPSDTTDYNGGSASVSLQVNKATPTITWATPAAITYGAALGSSQLDASATGVTGSSLAGTFVYTPAAGTVLTGGAQTLSVTFTPTDTTDYNVGSASVTLTVNKAAPALTWATPAAITYGAALGSSQLDASATGMTGSSLAGTFVYTPAAGTVLTGGAQTLSVTFTPTDTTDYNTETTTVTLTVNKAAPALTWATPAAITYGAALGSSQLDATASGVTGAALPGTFVYTPLMGIVLGVGSQTLSVTFTPTDTTDYNGASTTVLLTVNKETPTVTVSVSPEPSYPGDYATITATVNGVAAGYPTGTVTFTVDGSNASAVSLSIGTASLSYSFPNVGSHSITAVYDGDGSYNSAAGNGTHSVILIPTTSTVSATPNPAIGGQQAITLQTITIYPDLPLGTATKRQQPTGTVQFFDNGSLLGTAPIAATELAQLTVLSMTVGSHVLTASYSGDANYTGSNASRFTETLVAPFSALFVSGNNDATAAQSVTYAAVVMNPLNQPQQTGTVTWTSNGTVLGTSQVGANGSTSLTATFPTPGVYAVVVAYSGNQQPGTATVAQTVLSSGTNGSAPFTMSGSSTTLMNIDGSAQATLTFASAGDGSPVALTCSGVPTGYTCNLSPSTLTLTAGATPPSVTVSVTYTQPATQAQNKTGSEIAFAGLGLGLFGLFGLRRKWRTAGLLVLVIGTITAGLGMSGCGGMSYASYAPQSYEVTVTATVGKYQESFLVKVGR